MGGNSAVRSTASWLEVISDARAWLRLGPRPQPHHQRRVGRLVLAAVVVAVVVALLTGSGVAAQGTAPSGRAGKDVQPEARLVTPVTPPTTAPWPTPGYSEDELRPVVEALLQLATGASSTPTVASPDPAPSSTPRMTGPGTAKGPGAAGPDAPPPRVPEPSRDRSLSGWLVGIVALGALGGALFLISQRIRHRRRRDCRAAQSAADRGAVAAEAPTPAAVATRPIAERVDLGLRHAWAALGQAGRSAPPSVLAVRVGDLGIEVLLKAPDVDAPGRFVASDNGHGWTLSADVADEDLRRSVGNQPAPLPELVTVGGTPEGSVLVDLLHVGALSVEGDAARVEGFLAGAALEVATAPWAGATTLGLVGGDHRLTALANVESLAPREAPIADWLEATSNVAVIVVAPGTAGTEETQSIAAIVGSRPGRVGLVASGPIAGATWRLVLGPDGQGMLHPLGLELACAVDAEAVAATVEALGAEEVTVPAGPTAPGTAPEETRPTDASKTGVAVLGPVVVRWPPTAGVRRPTRRKLEEVVVYLAAHPERPVPAERLRTAIWPLSDDERSGEVADSSFRATMSRTRAALGTTANGRPYLPEARDGCYELDAAFGCDWVDFVALVRRARSAPASEAVALLSEALQLVRGAPFADTPRGAFSWAWSEQLVSVIEVAVADAAERLAELALATGDHDTARRAAEKGLLVVPTRESLYRARMRAAFEAGDIDDIEQAYTEVRRAVRAVDHAEEPQGETTALYERLRRAVRPANDDVTATGARRLAPVP